MGTSDRLPVLTPGRHDIQSDAINLYYSQKHKELGDKKWQGEDGGREIIRKQIAHEIQKSGVGSTSHAATQSTSSTNNLFLGESGFR